MAVRHIDHDWVTLQHLLSSFGGAELLGHIQAARHLICVTSIEVVLILRVVAQPALLSLRTRHFHLYRVSILLLNDRVFLFRVRRRRVLLCRVVIRVPVLSLPVGAYEATGLLEVGGLIQVLLSTLDLSLHAAPCLAPLAQIGSCFFVAALVSKLLVLVMEPDFLKLLLLELVGREVRKVARDSLKLVCCCVLHLLLRVGVEGLERWAVSGTLRLSERPCCV